MLGRRGSRGLIIRGKVYINGAVVESSIKVVDGIIRDVGKTIEDDDVIDFNLPGYLILPGMIDIHVHLRDFEYSYKEDFYTGTSAAAAGGVTLVLDMPNTKPKVNSLSILHKRDYIASRKSVVDYGIYYGVPDSLSMIEDYEKLAIGLKIYPEDMMADETLLDELFRYNSEKNIFTIFHPEDPMLRLKGIYSLDSEVKAAGDIASLSVKYGLRTHITHVSSYATVDEARKLNPKITFDTCPHYLSLYKDMFSSRYYSVSPPLRSRDVMESLRNHFSRGDIDILVTDHAPHHYSEKFGEHVWNGFPGLETALPLLLTLYADGDLSLKRVVDAYSSFPAKLLGLDNRLGSIEKGKYANFTVVDLDSVYTVDPSKFFSKAKHSPFVGWRMHGKVIATIVRGVMVYREDEVLVDKGFGENIIKHRGFPDV